ncbi:hypothetical protein TEA_022351 [Camellia sinensis var. sinensis]|uniref:Uncharacterized protein n=1 Tax=Camellia sinensis var. sinensis TaxID=542762 RepID=A0A4S4ERA2_CAMSN|nr:hypothetical protein TEA_022351 [Camellia sinensis var. sinensis]
MQADLISVFFTFSLEVRVGSIHVLSIFSLPSHLGNLHIIGPKATFTMITPLLDHYRSVWHHSRVRRYLTSEEYPGPESKGKPWYGLLMLLRKYPEHFVINTSHPAFDPSESDNIAYAQLQYKLLWSVVSLKLCFGAVNNSMNMNYVDGTSFVYGVLVVYCTLSVSL